MGFNHVIAALLWGGGGGGLDIVYRPSSSMLNRFLRNKNLDFSSHRCSDCPFGCLAHGHYELRGAIIAPDQVTFFLEIIELLLYSHSKVTSKTLRTARWP